MKNTNTNTRKQNKQELAPKANQIKLGIDIHADSYRVVRQLDNATLQPAQKFTPAAFLEWAAKQLTLADTVCSCYEAGSFGYGLHRKLAELGVKNFVVQPQKLDELNKGVKTDKTDALALTLRLDRYVNGNQHALAVVRVPSLQEEEARAISRHREQLCRHRQRLEQQGRSLLLYNGLRSDGRWWKPLFWNRFQNRRQVASMTGMCPRVYASGNTLRQGNISKHGNPRLRAALVEMAWRVIRWQPQYPPLRKWCAVLANKKVGGTMRKKAVVAIGRRLAIDLWRIETKRATAEELGLLLLR